MTPPFPDVEGEVRRALAERTLVLAYQPVVDLHDASLNGVEALLRWQHETGVLAAGAFLPEVHEPELIAEISAFVLDEAAQQLATWRRRFDSWLFPVSVNVAPIEFNEALVERIGSLCTQYALPPGALALDISEPLLMTDVDARRPLVAALKHAGAQILVDDFGTTFNGVGSPGEANDRSGDELMVSLVALEEFAVDVVKIDRRLVDRCFRSDGDARVIESIVRLAHLFGFRVLAEGVESGDEAERLRSSGFDLGQGYYFQPPHGPGHIDRLLHGLADAREAFAVASRSTPPR